MHKIALTGAHRTGKTTLAKQISKEFGLPYWPSDVTGMMNSLGYKFEEDQPLAKRLEMQQDIFDLYVDRLNNEAPAYGFITDRSPIDFASYLLSEAGASSDPNLSNSIKTFVVYAMVCANNFDMLVLTDILPTYVEEKNKPKPNIAYQMQIQVLIRGLLSAATRPSKLILQTSDKKERLKTCISFVHENLVSNAILPPYLKEGNFEFNA